MLVCIVLLNRWSFTDLYAGSGCIAALEAEKYLAEMEDGDDLEQEKTAVKGNNVVVPEYRGNPLL